jgi:hypothetical protein
MMLYCAYRVWSRYQIEIDAGSELYSLGFEMRLLLYLCSLNLGQSSVASTMSCCFTRRNIEVQGIIVPESISQTCKGVLSL